MSDTLSESDEPRSGYPRLEQQIAWYDSASLKAQRTYRALRILQVCIAAAVPIAALLQPNSAVVPGGLGAALLVLEGVQELGAYGRNWQKYRSTCEALRHQKYLYLAKAGPYQKPADDEDRLRRLAERVEMLISDEHLQWISQFERSREEEKRSS